MRRFGLILAVVLASGGLAASAGVDVDLRQEFPLLPGTQWIYRGYVRSHEDGSTVGKVTGVTWTMSVEWAVEREGFSVVLVRGFPSDLDWSEGNAKPQASVVVETRDGKFFLNSQENVQPVLDQIEEPGVSLRNLAVDVFDFSATAHGGQEILRRTGDAARGRNVLLAGERAASRGAGPREGSGAGSAVRLRHGIPHAAGR